MNIKVFQREMKSARKALKKSLERCQNLLWEMDRDGLTGQERTDAEEAIRIVERLKSAKGIL